MDKFNKSFHRYFPKYWNFSESSEEGENAFIQTMYMTIKKCAYEREFGMALGRTNGFCREHIPSSRVKITFTDHNINKRSSPNRYQT